MASELTFSIIKPDAVRKNKIGEILTRFESAGLKIVAARLEHLSSEKAQGFYAEHQGGQFSPLREQWHEWFDSLKLSFNNRFNPAIEVLGISYDYPEEKLGYHSAKVRVQGHNLHRFTRPPKDESGFAFIKLMKRE